MNNVVIWRKYFTFMVSHMYLILLTFGILKMWNCTLCNPPSLRIRDRRIIVFSRFLLTADTQKDKQIFKTSSDYFCWLKYILHEKWCHPFKIKHFLLGFEALIWQCTKNLSECRPYYYRNLRLILINQA